MGIDRYDWNKVKTRPDEHKINEDQRGRANRQDNALKDSKSSLARNMAQALKPSVAKPETPPAKTATLDKSKDLGSLKDSGPSTKPTGAEAEQVKQQTHFVDVARAAADFGKLAQVKKPSESLMPRNADPVAKPDQPRTQGEVATKQAAVSVAQGPQSGKTGADPVTRKMPPPANQTGKENEKPKLALASSAELPQEGLDHQVGTLQEAVAGGQVRTADKGRDEESGVARGKEKGDGKKSKKTGGAASSAGSVYRSDAGRELGELAGGMGSSTTSGGEAEVQVAPSEVEERPSLMEVPIGSQLLTERTEGVEEGFGVVFDGHRRLEEKVVQRKLTYYAELNEALGEKLKDDLKAIFTQELQSLPERILMSEDESEVRETLRRHIRLPGSPNGRGTIA